MKIKEQIANFFTLLNLASGVIACVSIINGNLFYAGVFIFAGALFDFFDGFVARALGIASDLGKQLDSLSDVVTFGVVPGLIAYRLLSFAFLGIPEWMPTNYVTMRTFYLHTHPVVWLALLIPLFSALRLAKFNIDTRQSKNFIGLPTPANGLMWASFAITFGSHAFSSDAITMLLESKAFLVACVIICSALLVSPLDLMGMKFDKFTWRGNEMKFSLIVVAIGLFVMLGFSAVPIILLLYIIFSIIHFYILKKT